VLILIAEVGDVFGVDNAKDPVNGFGIGRLNAGEEVVDPWRPCCLPVGSCTTSET